MVFLATSAKRNCVSSMLGSARGCRVILQVHALCAKTPTHRCKHMMKTMESHTSGYRLPSTRYVPNATLGCIFDFATPTSGLCIRHTFDEVGTRAIWRAQKSKRNSEHSEQRFGLANSWNSRPYVDAKGPVKSGGKD